MNWLVLGESPSLTKLYSYLRLDQGWHFGTGVPPTKERIRMAKTIVERAIMLMFETDTFPGIDGEIMITVYHENDYLEFTLEPDNSVTFIREQSGTTINYDEDLPLNSALKKLASFGEGIWNISELSTLSTLTPKSKDSPDWLLRITGEASRLFPENAFSGSEIMNVNTCANIMQEQAHSRSLLFIGSSLPMSYHPSAP